MLVLACTGQARQGSPTEVSTLARCSSRIVESPVRGTLAADADRIYLGTVDGTMTAFETGKLETVWRSELGGEFAADLLMLGGGLVAVTAPTGDARPEAGDGPVIRLIGKDSGIVAWSAKLPVSERFQVARLNGGVAAVSREGVTTLLDAASGQVRWQSASLGVVTTKTASSSDRIAFGTADKFLYVLSAKLGEILLKQAMDHVPTAVSFSSSGGILTGDERGNVALWPPQGGRPIWKFKSGAAVSSAVEANDGVLLTSFDNFVYFISDYNGDVIWKRRLPARLTDGGLVVGGQIVALVGGENSGYVLEPDKGKVTSVLPSLNKNIISLTPVLVRDRVFAFATVDSLETYAIGVCGEK